MGFGSFFKNAIHTAGRVAGSATHAVSSATGVVGNAITKVPVVGPGLHGVYDLTIAAPFHIADDIASGKRIDQVALNAIKNQVKDVREVGPYAQMVLSNVPGVGTGVSAALGAGLALSNGQPITEALKEGVRGALPGGPLARTAFDIGTAAAQGKPLDTLAIQALPIDDTQKRAVLSFATAAKAIASGARVDTTLINQGMANVPPDIKKAVGIGIAIGHGEKLQSIAAREAGSPTVIARLGLLGSKRVDPVIQAGREVLSQAETGVKTGYNIGLGLMTRSGITPVAMSSIRASLAPQERKGFDIGLATHIGLVTKKGKHAHPRVQFGRFVTHGMSGHDPEAKASIMTTVTRDPMVKIGAMNAAVERVHAKKSIWQKIKDYFQGSTSHTTGI